MTSPFAPKSPKTILSTLVFCAALLQACSPAPRHQLTNEEKAADLQWLYSQFNENYAPLKYKEQRYQFNFETVKAEALEKSKTTASNEDFYRLMYGVVAQVRDAHTAGSISNSSLPNRTQVAYLGFSGKRNGNMLEVTELLPTIKKATNYPIATGDKIIKLGGRELPAIIREDFVKIRNTGNDQSNLTFFINRIFNRVSTSSFMPSEQDAVLTVLKSGESDLKKAQEITLPWIVKDLTVFSQEQNEASEKKSSDDTSDSIVNPFALGLAAMSNPEAWSLDLLPGLFKAIQRNQPGFDFMNTFAFVDDSLEIQSDLVRTALKNYGRAMKTKGVLVAGFNADDDEAETPTDELKKKRNIPTDVLWVNEAKTYPTFISMESVKDSKGTDTGKEEKVATMYLNTFSPESSSKTVLTEVKNTLRILQIQGVKNLIIDLLDNGGGSLQLGLQLSQLLNKDKITLPGIQFKLSETWIDDFEKDSLNSDNDYDKEKARRIHAALKTDKDSGKWLSTNFNSKELVSEIITANSDIKENFKIVLMVNEMCASMCDIFSATLQDNKMATIVGQQTMGAGGNVVEHSDAPNSHFKVRQTESLITRADGSYIENNGIKPDVEIATYENITTKYDKVREAAIKAILTVPANE